VSLRFLFTSLQISRANGIEKELVIGNWFIGLLGIINWLRKPACRQTGYGRDHTLQKTPPRVPLGRGSQFSIFNSQFL